MRRLLYLSLQVLIIILFLSGNSCKKDEPEPQVPTLTTISASAISYTTATSGGNISDDGGVSVLVRGVCWNTTGSPGISNTKTTDGSGSGAFISSLTELIPNTTYHLRAYATNSVGTAFGNEVTFTTLQVSAPSVTTNAVTSITSSSAVSGGNVSSENGSQVTAKGVCWNTAENPTVDDSKTSDGTGTGSYNSNIADLLPGTTYYVRAYATNSAGTGYGDQLSFTTLAEVPAVTTADITEITLTSATGGGEVTGDGGADVTARGICYSTSASPTLEDTYTTEGTGTGTFTSSLADLTPGTTYYVKAYATNSVGTAYGDEVQFTTLKNPQIRLKTGSGLNPGASIYFVALSKDVNYFNLTTDEKFNYDKTLADWYIDGGIIPFTTEYKEFPLPTGTYYLLLRGSGTVVVTTKTISEGDQTYVISGTTYGGINITTTYPKKSDEYDPAGTSPSVNFEPGAFEYIIRR